jgi:hypothetical protein
MRPANETNNKRSQAKARSQDKSKPTKNEANTESQGSKKKGPKKQAKEELNSNNPTADTLRTGFQCPSSSSVQ